MARRNVTGRIGGPSRDDIQGSVFAPHNPPRIPARLAPPVRKEVKAILDVTSHLTDRDMAAVTRLAQLRVRFAEMQQAIDADGAVVFNAKTQRREPNPVIARLVQVQNAVLSQERQLALTVRAQRELLTVSEQKVPKLEEKVNSRRPLGLRLA